MKGHNEVVKFQQKRKGFKRHFLVKLPWHNKYRWNQLSAAHLMKMEYQFKVGECGVCDL